MIETIEQIVKDGFRVLENHEREQIVKDNKSYGVIGAYMVIETPEGKHILYSPENNTYLEFEVNNGEQNGK